MNPLIILFGSFWFVTGIFAFDYGLQCFNLLTRCEPMMPLMAIYSIFAVGIGFGIIVHGIKRKIPLQNKPDVS